MENTNNLDKEQIRSKCTELANRIYDFDEKVYKATGSSLGRTFSHDRDLAIDRIVSTLMTQPKGYDIRTSMALIGNMARTIRNKAERKAIMHEYNDILNEISTIPVSFGSVDIIDESIANLNTSNLHSKFSDNDHLVICIGKTYGAAATDIGFALADALRINYYDAEIFNNVLTRLEAEKDSVYDEYDPDVDIINKRPKNPIKRILSDISRYHGLPKRDAIFFNQSDLICDMAKKEDFIVMGRCADVVLTNKKIPHISIFITAPFEVRARRIMAIHNLTYKQACKALKKIDRRHKRYYNFYTRRKWGHAVNYDLCINSASYGIQESVELIERIINKFPKIKKEEKSV